MDATLKFSLTEQGLHTEGFCANDVSGIDQNGISLNKFWFSMRFVWLKHVFCASGVARVNDILRGGNPQMLPPS